MRIKEILQEKNFQRLYVLGVHTFTGAYKCEHFQQRVLKIIDAEVMIDGEGFMQQRGTG